MNRLALGFLFAFALTIGSPVKAHEKLRECINAWDVNGVQDFCVGRVLAYGAKQAGLEKKPKDKSYFEQLRQYQHKITKWLGLASSLVAEINELKGFQNQLLGASLPSSDLHSLLRQSDVQFNRRHVLPELDAAVDPAPLEEEMHSDEEVPFLERAQGAMAQAASAVSSLAVRATKSLVRKVDRAFIGYEKKDQYSVNRLHPDGSPILHWYVELGEENDEWSKKKPEVAASSEIEGARAAEDTETPAYKRRQKLIQARARHP